MKHPLIPLLDALRTCEVPHDFDGETVSFYNVRVSARVAPALRVFEDKKPGGVVSSSPAIQVRLDDGDAAYGYVSADPEEIAQFALSRAVGDDPKLEEARAFQRNWSEG
jgi:endonuclease YncB( thermonuclease family)